ncbi:MOSC domain-containing protein [Pseudonocardia nigra]|uniref:MOSC domain-containing protein n=1 Tax=Pseudonocardia nigra TaxID=1921578 RepID=UPI001C5E61FB|nr:MOSC N-terminal beta barrel domain-containing protein [Pseudonocardia nigra]
MPITAIHRYPVKSMLGESLASCVVDSRGIPGDRAYAVVDAGTGTVASAKVPRRWSGLLDFSARYVAEPRPGEAPLPVEITFPDGSVLRSDDPGIDEALSAILGRPVRLTTARPAEAHFEEVWPEIEGLAPQAVIDGTQVRREDTGEAVSRFDVAAMAPGSTAFFDLAVLHVLTGSTLDRLRELAPDATFDAQRYRPNLVLDGAPAGFAENEWPGRTIAFDAGPRITVSIPTMRCVMTTLAQGDLPRDPVTLRTIAKHNRVDIPNLGTWACAGVYADVTVAGEIAVGDDHRVEPVA